MHDSVNGLYRYYNLRQEVEDEIEGMRKKFGDDYSGYQVWFQGHYPTMQIKLENAYMEWIVFGQKEIVESYRAKVDTSSIGEQLQEARIALRSSEKLTLDRSSKAYPVHFTPSNWYTHLQPRLVNF